MARLSKGWHTKRYASGTYSEEILQPQCSSCGMPVFAKNSAAGAKFCPSTSMKFSWFEFGRHKAGTKWPIFQCRIVCTALAKCPRYNIEKKANVCLVSTSSRTVPATWVLYVRAEGFEHPRPQPHDPPPPKHFLECAMREKSCVVGITMISILDSNKSVNLLN